MLRILAFVFLAIFLLLYGLGAITNFRFELMGTITGLAAIAAGILFAVLAFKAAPA